MEKQGSWGWRRPCSSLGQKWVFWLFCTSGVIGIITFTVMGRGTWWVLGGCREDVARMMLVPLVTGCGQKRPPLRISGAGGKDLIAPLYGCSSYHHPEQLHIHPLRAGIGRECPNVALPEDLLCAQSCPRHLDPCGACRPGRARKGNNP